MHVSEWTRQHGKYELMALLRAAGVRAGALQSGRDRLEHDESLRDRQVFQWLTHDVLGEHRYESFPMLVNGEPLALRPSGPSSAATQKRCSATSWACPRPGR